MTEHHDTLPEALSRSLPEGTRFTSYHISTLPSPCRALFSPPPNQKTEKTYCESHSLLITVPPDAQYFENDPGIAVFAIELQIYTTSHLTTVFVSKADSTGYLSILDLPRHTGSVLQSTTSAFVSWVIRHRHRTDRRLVLSLFARAQNQYLFPGSVHNGRKHILDDRALVKWWCKTLDPVLREYALEAPNGSEDAAPTGNKENPVIRAKAHLIVPGHDPYETQAFFPRSFRADPPSQRRWANSHPLRQLTNHPGAPPRCLVPHFPDDPKARFLSDLDDELADAPQSTSQASSSSKFESPSKRGKGQWKSVKTLEEFWELMAFRQECSSGRLVGFLWIVFTPDTLPNSTTDATKNGGEPPSPSPTTRKRKADDRATATQSPAPKRSKAASRRIGRHRPAKTKLKGPIYPRPPRVKSMADTAPGSMSTASSFRSTTQHYHSPPSARGALVLSQKAYDRVHELLLRLDFSNLEISRSSTKRWVNETGVIAGAAGEWGERIEGTRTSGSSLDAVAASDEPVASSKQPSAGGGGGVTMLVAKKKRPRDEEASDMSNATPSRQAEGSASADMGAGPPSDRPVNTLSSSIVRKKSKSETPNSSLGAPEAPPPPEERGGENKVNTLGGGLVRKKAKP